MTNREGTSHQQPLSVDVRLAGGPLPMWVFDLETLEILDANDAAVALYGYTRDELMQKCVTDLRASRDAGDETVHVDALEATLPIAATRRYRRKDGTLIDAHILARPIAFRGRAAVLAVAQDIAELKRAAEATTARSALLDRLADLTDTLARPLRVAEIIPAIGEAALQCSGAGRGAVYIRNRDGTITCAWAEGLSEAFLAQVAGDPRDLPAMVLGAPPAAGFLALPDGRMVNGRHPLLCADVDTLPLDSIVRQRGRQAGYRALGLLPLSYEGRITVVIGCYYDHPHMWSREEADALQAFARQAAIELENAQLVQRLRHAYARMALALAQAIDAHGTEPGTRAARLVGLAAATAGALGCPVEDVEDVRWGARLYDIGMMAVPDEIAMKPDSLTEEEWAVVRQHPVVGEEILRSVEQLHRAAALVRHHQERWDGLGYPDGLRGEQIPVGARILAVLEAHAAMSRPRPYRPARARDEVMTEIRRGAGTQFDPAVVDAFSTALGSDVEEHEWVEPLWTPAGQATATGAAMPGRQPPRRSLDDTLLAALQALPDGARQLVHLLDKDDVILEVEEHLAHVGQWSMRLAAAAGVVPERQRLVAQAALVHDIGKLGLSRTLLRKPGTLSADERALLVQHVNKGVVLLRALDVDEGVVDIVAAHHERWDGAGYPQGLAGDAIPLEARILAIADSFDAMTSERVYHRTRTPHEAAVELRREAGRQFDARLIDLFIVLLQKAS